ncbi:MAG TPA: hypothetical protein PKA63_01445 [Oligoflexia bacterium]|nr:hypothetical protein [Oligoflexia bacterium]HMP47313.1 hypothetical protein [Oligoflexia bacterium]
MLSRVLKRLRVNRIARDFHSIHYPWHGKNIDMKVFDDVFSPTSEAKRKENEKKFKEKMLDYAMSDKSISKTMVAQNLNRDDISAIYDTLLSSWSTIVPLTGPNSLGIVPLVDILLYEEPLTYYAAMMKKVEQSNDQNSYNHILYVLSRLCEYFDSRNRKGKLYAEIDRPLYSYKS